MDERRRDFPIRTSRKKQAKRESKIGIDFTAEYVNAPPTNVAYTD
jgi:hypothetical protein